MKIISIENFNKRMKTIETKSIKKYGESITWVGLSHKFNSCIIEINDKTIIIDEDKYKKIRNSILKGE